MAGTGKHSNYRYGIHLLMRQMLFVVLIALSFLLFSGYLAMFSAFLGGLVCVSANWVFLHKALRLTAASQAQRMLTNFYQAEFFKIVFSALFFAICFKFFKVEAVVFFVAYILTSLSVCIFACLPHRQGNAAMKKVVSSI